MKTRTLGIIAIVICGLSFGTPIVTRYLSNSVDKFNWSEASKDNTLESFQEYIKKHPDGIYISIANSNLQYIEKQNQFQNLVNQGEIFAKNVAQKRYSSNVRVEIIRILGGKAKTVQDNSFRLMGEDIDLLNFLQYNEEDNLVSITFKIVNNKNIDLTFGGNQVILSVGGKQFNLTQTPNIYSNSFSGNVLRNSTLTFSTWFNIGDIDLRKIKTPKFQVCKYL